ncbi:MAG: 50S ribosomal protein L10 [Syntrophomonadaceae bacterium]|nr:50S ribosomal protein L10 [Syntrophomonadaceae bacterium]
MPKLEEKQKVVEEIKQKFQDVSLVIFTDYRGINVEEMTELRNRLRQPGVEYKVLKNTMLRFALEKLGYEDMVDSIVGPNAVLFSAEDPVTPAKTIFDFSKQYKKLEVKVGILEGQVVSAEKIKSLAELPAKEELLAQVVGTMQAPITSFVYVLNANLSGLVRAIDQIRQQKEAG